MDERLVKIKDTLLAGKSGEMEDELFVYTNRLKYAITLLIDYPHKHRHELVKMVQETYQQDELSNSYCYKLLADGQELFPSIEKVNKTFELARLIKYGYTLLHHAEQKKNVRDGASVLKVLRELIDMADDDEAKGGGTTIINILRSAPETLNIKLPENFVLTDFIAELEKEYDPRNTVDIEHEEIR